jgi:hypothetical protein
VEIYTAQNCELPADGRELRPEHVAAIINKTFVQEVGIKYYTISSVVCVPQLPLPARF